MTIRELAVGVAVGIAAAFLRMVYIFFPMFNLLDLVVFGVAGYGVGRTRPKRRWLSFALIILPALAFIGFVLVNLGPQKVAEGVGIGHAYAAVLIPAATGIGLLVSGRGNGGLRWAGGA
jgi:hypothetical protein